MPDRLDELAGRFGIADGYLSEKGEWVRTPTDTKVKVLAAMGVPLEASADGKGDHRDIPEPPPAEDVASLSASAFWPPFLVDQRAWGLAVQAYALRSGRNWGIGDFEDLARLAEFAAGLGADFIGVSPMHALFMADPSRISPYSPSSRDFLNALLIAPDRVPGFADLAERNALDAELADLRATTLIDYPAVHRVKLRALEGLFAHVRQGRGRRARKRRSSSFAANRARPSKGTPCSKHCPSASWPKA